MPKTHWLVYAENGVAPKCRKRIGLYVVKSDSEPQMRLDLTEDDKNFFVKAEIPGVKKEDIKVSVEGNQVSLSAEVKKEKEEKEGSKIIRSERYYGSVARSFTLDESVDQAKASAKYEDGVLQLTLPKKPNGQSHLLKIA